MNWRSAAPAPSGTHHLLEGVPAYADRFDEVMAFHEPGLAPVRRDDCAWHIHVDGVAAYAQRFRRTFGFYEGLAAVAAEDGWHHVRSSGDEAYRGRFAWCGNFQGGRCAVRRSDGAYHHITVDGAPAYAERWRYVGDYRDGHAVVQAPDGRSTHVDLVGQTTHGRWFLDLDVFHKGFARARDEDGWTHITRTGAPVSTRRFAAVEPFYNGQARVERFDGGLEVIDETGSTLVELRPSRRSDFATLSEDLVGFWRTQTIATAVGLGVFEALPGTADEIAHRCSLRRDGAARLLRALGELALVTLEGASWRATVRGELLGPQHPLTLADAALEYAGPLSRMWTSLPEALRADGDWRAPDIFGDVAGDARRRVAHHRMLTSYARHDYPAVTSALELRGDEHVVDAGGGQGTLATLLFDAHPALRVTVLDRPEVIDQAQRAHAGRAGLDWRSADLFAPWGLEADAVVLARVLHDWPDAAATRILRRARGSLRPGGLLFVVEMMVPEDGVAGALCDLHLLVATGGEERTSAAYRRLLAGAGFGPREVRALPALPSVLVGVAR